MQAFFLYKFLETVSGVLHLSYVENYTESFLIFCAVFLSKFLLPTLTALLALSACFYTAIIASDSLRYELLWYEHDHEDFPIASSIVLKNNSTFILE